ncbi:hypothetical protein ABIF74_011788 [Bradyrhizobium japonicum]
MPVLMSVLMHGTSVPRVVKSTRESRSSRPPKRGGVVVPLSFQRMDRWGDGNTVAYYQASCRNPETGKFERYSWRYMLRNGQLVLHKTFPVKAEDWRDKTADTVRAAE